MESVTQNLKVSVILYYIDCVLCPVLEVRTQICGDKIGLRSQAKNEVNACLGLIGKSILNL
jgi:hypothetical protein